MFLTSFLIFLIWSNFVGKWAKPANKEKILNVVGKRNTFRIDGGNKSWWPELENALFNWFKQQRQKGACVSDSCFKLQALSIFDDIYLELDLSDGEIDSMNLMDIDANDEIPSAQGPPTLPTTTCAPINVNKFRNRRIV